MSVDNLTNEQTVFGLATFICGIATLISIYFDSIGGIFVFSISTLTFCGLLLVDLDNEEYLYIK